MSYVKTILRFLSSHRKILLYEVTVMARIIDGEAQNLIGEIVRKYRKLNRMTQNDLSVKLELLGVYVCRGSISRIEDKSRTVTDIELYAIAKVLSIPWDELSPEKLFADG